MKQKRRFSWANRILAMIVVATAALLAAGAFVLWPAYINPESRIYTTALGYLKVQRWFGIKLPAVAERPVWHDFETPLLGEGTIQCNFYYVPVVPTARDAAMHLGEGAVMKCRHLVVELGDKESRF